MANVFRRFIEIVLDKASAQKAKRDTQQALDQATDSKKATANLAGVGRALEHTVRLFTQAAAAVAGYALAITKLTERGGKVLEVERAFGRVVGDTEAALAKLRKTTRGLVSDYDLMVGMNKAVTLGAAETAEQYAELADPALTLGRALGVDAAFALESLTLGIGRQSRLILDNLGLIVKVEEANKRYADQLGKNVNALTANEKREAFRAAAMDAARLKIEQLGGVLENNADLLQRTRTLLVNIRDEIAKFAAKSDTLGTLFFEAGNFLETLLLGMQAGIGPARQAFAGIGRILGMSFADAFASAVGSVLKDLETRHPILESALGLVGGALTGAAAGGLAGAAFGGVGAFPGALGGAVVGGIIGANSGVAGRVANAVSGQIVGDSEARAQAIQAEVVALEALRKELTALLRLRGQGAPPPGSPPGVDAPTADEIKRAEDERLKLLLKGHELRILTIKEQRELKQLWLDESDALKNGNLSLEDRARLMERVASIRAVLIAQDKKVQKESGEAPGKKQRKSEDALLEQAFGGWYDEALSASQTAALGMQSAWESAFLAINDKSEALAELEIERQRRMAEATTAAQRKKVDEWYAIERENAENLNGLWETLARGFAASILSGLAQVAAAKVAENIARALEATGQGLMGNPAAFAAAAEFAAAAAAWGALGGLAGAAAQGVGGSTSSFRGSDAVGRQIDKLDRDGGEIHLHIDGVDPKNPRHQALIGQTARQYQERYGGRIIMEGA